MGRECFFCGRMKMWAEDQGKGIDRWLAFVVRGRHSYSQYLYYNTTIQQSIQQSIQRVPYRPHQSKQHYLLHSTYTHSTVSHHTTSSGRLGLAGKPVTEPPHPVFHPHGPVGCPTFTLTTTNTNDHHCHCHYCYHCYFCYYCSAVTIT